MEKEIKKEKKVNIFEGRTKEWNEKDWQGRTQKQVEDNHKIMGIALLGLFTTLVGLIIYGIFK